MDIRQSGSHAGSLQIGAVDRGLKPKSLYPDTQNDPTIHGIG